MFRKNSISKLIYDFLSAFPLRDFSINSLMECLKKYRPNLKRSTLKRELSRLAKKGLIDRTGRGKYAYIPASNNNFIDRAKAYEIANKVRTLISKTLGYDIPATPQNQKLIYRTIQQLISELSYQTRKNNLS